MNMMNIRIFSLGLAGCLGFASPLAAAVTTVSGGVSTGYEYFDRQYDDSSASDDDDYSRFKISPFVTIVSETARHSLAFKYVPTFWYDVDESEDDVDHDLSLEYIRALTRYWNVSVADYLSITDEFNSYSPTTDPESGDITSEGPGADPAGDTLRDENGRRKYTNNSLELGTSYMYYEDSSVALDYIWTALRNDSDYSGSSYQDYDKHDVGLTLGHRLNSRWKATAVAGIVRGLYESVEDDSASLIPADSDDVDEYRASLLMDHKLSPLHSLSGYYGYNLSDYDSNLRNDSEIHNVTLGWGWSVSPKLQLNMGAGPTYTKVDGSSGDWGTNANFGLNYRLEKGLVGVKLTHGTEADNFSGTDDRGTTDFWRLQTNLQHAFTERTSLSAYASYSNEDRNEAAASGPSATDTITEEVYATGCRLNYRFAENYVAGLSYGYVHNTSDSEENDYDDHTIALTVTYEKDFFQW